MRKWHRWLSVLFGVFLLCIAATGLTLQILPEDGDHDNDRPGQAVQLHEQVAVPAGFVCPQTMLCLPKEPEGDEDADLRKFIMHLHSGEAFGLPGKVISVFSALALLFFSFSGLWLYIQMWRHRKERNLTPRWWWQ